MTQLVKGNEAAVEGALLAGCRAYFGYPITPASEIAETAARDFPKVGGTFIQAESEVSAINMVYGAASAGLRSMTGSSGPGISLMQECLSYMAGAQLPCVVVDIMRGGPGLGNIAPDQGDYHQVVWGGGHGNYRTLVLAPASVQEMCDLTILAFELADKYRNPVFVLTDGAIGQMVEPVVFPPAVQELPTKPWAVEANAETRKNLISSIILDPAKLEKHNRDLEAKYDKAHDAEQRFETYRVEDAEEIFIAYGIVARILQSTVDLAREAGIRVGLLRPISLWPYPERALEGLVEQTRTFHVVELSNGQMVRDVQLVLNGRRPTTHYSRMGGILPSSEELLEHLQSQLEVTSHGTA
ncbi:MAG: 3-methyl-2-oxobutanoate dehydrogenase subunit VorB [Candidatus Latescibacterota bacterium]|nr:MAG: 3-methyl-2-oxobutanoate dehydrogenase subunit VorB [Candidatus Latescibacterota bacterium]